MIQFVWIIIKDTPIAGMRFIKLSDQKERERLEKFYGWLSGPISEFTGKVQDIIIEGSKYYYHSSNDVLFVVGTDLDETSIPSVFIPELEERFFLDFKEDIAARFNGKDLSQFRSINSNLVSLVKAFEQRKIEAKGKRKDLDAFEVLNLPTELQMVALVIVKMQVVTPDMVSQVSGLTVEEVDRQLREIYQRGYLFITTISNKSYYSIKPFESDKALGLITRRPAQIELEESSETISQTPAETQPSQKEEIAPPIDLPQADSVLSSEMPSETVESAMMAPPDWDISTAGAESSFGIPSTESMDADLPNLVSTDTIQPRLVDATEPPEKAPVKKEVKSIKLKEDPIAKEIDQKHRATIIIPKSGFLPTNSLRREKAFASGKIRIPSEKNKDPFYLNTLFKKDLEHVYEALFMGDFIVITSENFALFEEETIDKLFESMKFLTPHRRLTCIKSKTFIHPKDADVIAIPKDLLKYYSWATVIDIDHNRIFGGKSSEYARNFVKRIKKITDSKEFMKEITSTVSVLLKVARDINTLKIEGRSPDLYLNEVKKAFGIAALDAGLSLSEKLIRNYKDCAYIAGFYIRKGLDIAVRAIIVGEPIVVIGDDPIDIYHVIEALSIFAPHKAINAQIWTANFAGIDINKFDIMGAQEGTDKLFKGAIKVAFKSMSCYGGPRCEFLHSFLRQMWRRRSKERPKFIREKVNEMINNANKVIQKFSSYKDRDPTKQEVRDALSAFDPNFGEFVIDLIKNEHSELASKIKNLL